MNILVLHGSKPSSNSREMVEVAMRLGHKVYDGPTSDMSALVSPNGSRFWLGREEVTDAKLCFLRSYGPGSCEQTTRRISLLEHMEMAGIKVINSSYPFRRARDKYATQYTLKHHGLPIPTTFVTESLPRAYELTQEMGEVIYKPILGSMGRGSMKFTDTDLAYNAYRTLDRLQHPLVIQKYVKYLPDNNWKSNVAQGGKMVEEPINEEILKLGVKATEVMGLEYAGVDLLESPEGPIVLEVNASPGWQGIKSATGKDFAQMIVEYGIEKAK